MWICKKCNEEIEDSFDACWNCTTIIEVEESLSKKEKELEKIKKKREELYNSLMKKIEETKKKTGDILGLKRRNEERVRKVSNS